MKTKDILVTVVLSIFCGVISNEITPVPAKGKIVMSITMTAAFLAGFGGGMLFRLGRNKGWIKSNSDMWAGYFLFMCTYFLVAALVSLAFA